MSPETAASSSPDVESVARRARELEVGRHGADAERLSRLLAPDRRGHGYHRQAGRPEHHQGCAHVYRSST